MRNLKDLEQQLSHAHFVVPDTPDLALILRNVDNVATRRQLPTALLLLLRVFAMLLLVGAAYATIQIIGTRSVKTLAKLTPLRVVNEAWSAADGYVLNFTVFDSKPALNQRGDGPNLTRFESAVYEWADRKGLKRPEGDADWNKDKLGVMLLRTGYAGADLYVAAHVQVNLRSDDEELRDDLIRTAAVLPGVAEPEVFAMTMHFGMGGLTTVTKDAKAYINGEAYDFPEDFTSKEAQDLYFMFSSLAQDPIIEYRAFADKFLAEETLDPRRGVTYQNGQAVGPRDIKVTRRFDLGDVIRISKDAGGSVQIDTYLETWDVPESTLDRLGLQSNWGGWNLRIPSGTDEKKLDVLFELSRKFDPLPGDRKNHRYGCSLTYWLYPLEELITKSSLDMTVAEKQSALEKSAALQAAFTDWQEQRPELQRSLVYGSRAYANTVKAGPNTIAFNAGLNTDDLTELDSLRDALNAVPGAPTPEKHIHDHQEYFRTHGFPEYKSPLTAPLK